MRADGWLAGRDGSAGRPGPPPSVVSRRFRRTPGIRAGVPRPPLMSTIGELGSFLAREKAAARTPDAVSAAVVLPPNGDLPAVDAQP